MTAKKPFVEPQIASETDLESTDKGFPLVPGFSGSGGASDVSDGAVDGGFPDPAFDNAD